MKSYSDNFLLKGVVYLIKDAQGSEEIEEKFREKILRIFVDQGLLQARRLFVCGNGPEKGRILRGVVRHIHPLTAKDNASVVVAFLESWLAGMINQKLNGGKRLKDGIHVIPHVPPIIDALRNNALKYRVDVKRTDPNRRIIMSKTLKSPWIQLLEVKNGKKTAIDFPVDDKRLVKPAVTLAKLELKGRDSFTPKALLQPDEKEQCGEGVVKAKALKRRRGDDDDDDDDDDDEDIDDEDVDEVMDIDV